eukprot:14340289-Heterocapsa_arctica.AAC.1
MGEAVPITISRGRTSTAPREHRLRRGILAVGRLIAAWRLARRWRIVRRCSTRGLRGGSWIPPRGAVSSAYEHRPNRHCAL